MLNKFWLSKNSKKSTKVPVQNMEIDDEIIKQVKNLIKVYSIVNQTLVEEVDDIHHIDPFNRNPINDTLICLEKAITMLEKDRKMEKDKENKKVEFDIWFNSRK